jgi:hypothetical protein
MTQDGGQLRHLPRSKKLTAWEAYCLCFPLTASERRWLAQAIETARLLLLAGELV